MTARRFPNRAACPHGEEGVSTVLGAVLMFGILVITLVMVQTQFVPVWDEDRESEHMDEVVGQFGRIAADVSRQVQDNVTASVADPVLLERPGGLRFFTGARLPSTLAFQEAAAGSGVTLTSPRVTIFRQNDLEVVAIADQSTWTPLDNLNDTYSDIQNLRVLRVQIPWPAGANDCNLPQTALLSIRDATTTELARIEITCHDSSSERSFTTSVFHRFSAAQGFSLISGETEAIFQGADADFFFVDLMRSELLLAPILASMTLPVSLDMQEIGLSASYVLVYDDTSGGTVGGGSGQGGQTVAPYPPVATVYGGGALTFTAHNQRFVEQQYVFEHGAVLRVQQDGVAMAVPPRFDVRPTTQQTRIDWDLPSLKGASQGLVGATSATVSSDRAGPGLSLLAGAATLNITVPTSYPATWSAFFEREMQESGLNATAYTLTPGAASVLLQVRGMSSDDAVDDLLLSFTQADITIEVSTTG